jgi:hypothetical protein
MRWNTAILILALALLTTPIRAAAQEPWHDPWVAGRIIWDSDQSWNVPLPPSLGVGGALGIEVSQRLGLEVAGDWPRSRTTISVVTLHDPVFGLEDCEPLPINRLLSAAHC